MEHFEIIEFSVYGIWMLSEIIINNSRRGGGQANKGKYTNALISVVSISSLSLGIFIGMLAKFMDLRWLYSPNYVICSIGLFLVLAGIAIRWSAVLTLKKFFTIDVAIQPDHQVVQTGLFKYVRHPSYLGILLSVLGLGISMVNWASILVIIIPHFLILTGRIKEEEAVLVGHFGPVYEDYRRRTKALLPFIY
jgi:protein-S-isoprenylcysteine O-methyltransferase Ste14